MGHVSSQHSLPCFKARARRLLLRPLGEPSIGLLLSGPLQETTHYHREEEMTMGCPEIEAFVRHWGYIHKQTARVLRAVPADRMDYKPKEDMMSLGALTIHIPQAALLFARTAL